MSCWDLSLDTRLMITSFMNKDHIYNNNILYIEISQYLVTIYLVYV